MKQAFTGREFGIVYKKVKLDENDFKIMKVLAQNARIPISDISRKTGLPRERIKYRLRRLEREKVITGYMPIYKPPAFGLNNLLWVLISLQNLTPKKEKELSRYLESVSNITYVSTTMGKWDYLITIFAKNPGHFSEIMKRMREKFSDIIKDYEVITTIEEIKWTHFPGKVI